eukprot:COSAG02_NODE_901_length_16056_cov_52.549477_10_plen_716_part_00
MSEFGQQVFPEFLEYKLDEHSLLSHTDVLARVELAKASIDDDCASSQTSNAVNVRHKWRQSILGVLNKRTGPQLWGEMRPKVRVIANLAKAWGTLDNKGSATSTVHGATIPWYMRDPDSNFSGVWDLASVLFLLYVCASVPIRACFPENIPGNMDHLEILSLTWTIDTITDFYFILDVILNFFTALPDPYDGSPIIDRKIIARTYMKGWFAIDFLSSLPIEYIEMLVTGSGTGGDTLDLQFLKTLRLLRLAKMLRLARLQRILQKYENLAKVQEYGGFGMLVIVIATMAHLLTCLWYTIGEGQEVVQGHLHFGWVHKEWSPANDTSVSLSIRYYTAMYSVFNLLDRDSEIQSEMRFAVLGHFVLIMFDGAVAGVMSAMMIAMQGNEREYNDRISTAKQWMKEQQIPKFRSDAALDYFRTFYKSNVAMQEKQVLGCMTPAMRLEFCTFLYSKYIGAVPLFHGLPPGIIRALCQHIEPSFAVRGQVVYGEGSTGRELYIVIAGELEITAGGQRLGFISDGGFFGETPILEASAHAEVRRRTVTAVTSCKLCFLHADDVDKVKAKYPELSLRLLRCGVRSGKTKGGKFRDAMVDAAELGVDIKPNKKKAAFRSPSLNRSRSMGAMSSSKSGSSSPVVIPNGHRMTRNSGAPVGVDEGHASAGSTGTHAADKSSVRQELTALSFKVDLMAQQQASIVEALARIEAATNTRSDTTLFRPP